MHTVCRVLKRDGDGLSLPAGGAGGAPRAGNDKNLEEERKRLKTSLKDLERQRLFEEWKVKDVQKDVQTRDAIIAEKDKQIATLTPLHQENVTLRKRVEDLQASLLTAAKTNQALETRLAKQATELADTFNKRMEKARNASMDTINEHTQALFILFQKHTDPRTREEALGDFVIHVDAIRTAVGINMI